LHCGQVRSDGAPLATGSIVDRMGAMDIAIESVWLLQYSSSIGLGCDASILAVLHVRIGVAQGGGPGLAVAEEK